MQDEYSMTSASLEDSVPKVQSCSMPVSSGPAGGGPGSGSCSAWGLGVGGKQRLPAHHCHGAHAQGSREGQL